MKAVSQWWIGGLRTRKAKVAGSIPAGGSMNLTQITNIRTWLVTIFCLDAILGCNRDGYRRITFLQSFSEMLDITGISQVSQSAVKNFFPWKNRNTGTSIGRIIA